MNNPELLPARAPRDSSVKPMHVERGLVATRYGYIHYRHAGSAHRRCVIISHINQQSSALMLELIGALSGHVHAVAFDYPSCGMSDHVSEQPSIEDYASCAIAVMDALGIEDAIALGEATGAFVSAALAASYPQRIDAAVLVNCPYYPEKSVSERAHAPLQSSLRPGDSTGFPLTRTLDFVMEHDQTHAPVNADQSWMDRINVAQIEAGRDRWQPLKALGAYDLPAALRKIACPVLFMMGEHFHYRKDLDTLVSLAALAQGEVVPGARFCLTWSHASHVAARAFAFSEALPAR
jgi:pimeloyl-ACP methyl ester carboxylesterase